MNNSSLRHPARGGGLLLGILLIAANLRAPFTALPPLLAPIQQAYALSAAATGALTALPLLAFALMSPLGARVARARGLEPALFGALAAIAAGIALRSGGAAWCLYLGTGLLGLGIAVGNVLLPSLIKRDYPHQVAAVTGAYALSMGLAAALASAAVIPLARATDWRAALGALLLLPLLALAVWIPQLRRHSRPAAASASTGPGLPLWRSALAWQVTLFLGLNSTIYYVAIGWLPAMLGEAGLSAEQAGSLHGALQLATAVPGLLLAPLLRRLRDQRALGFVVGLLSAVALLGLRLAPGWALLWCLLLGLGTGAGIILGLSFMALRSHNAAQAAALSGMAQCVGYLLASAGPPVVGALHAASGAWALPLSLCAGLALLASAMGWLAGGERSLGDANRGAEHT